MLPATTAVLQPETEPTMPIPLTLPVRTWAALDAALGFFRSAPNEMPAAHKMAQHCRQFHRALKKIGLECEYRLIAALPTHKPLLRLHLKWGGPAVQPLVLRLPVPVVRSLVRACLTIVSAQTQLEADALLDYEVEELQATRAFLSEVRRQACGPQNLVPERRGRQPLSWDERRKEYGFSPRMAARVHLHYLRAGASMN
jgi:hypothetical protein